MTIFERIFCVIGSGSSLYPYFRRREIVHWEGTRYEVRDTGLGERVYYRVFVRLGARQRGPPIPSPPPPPPPFPSPFQPLSQCSTTCIPVSIIPAALFVCTCKCTRVLCLPMPHHHHRQRFRSVQPVFLHEALNESGR